MSLTIKATPQDFIVKEIAVLQVLPAGEFGLYLLTKEGCNTVELLQEIARALKITFDRFSYGGRKDKYAHTSQYITIRGGGPALQAKDSRFSFEFIGFCSRPMAPDLIERNEFEITVRGLTEAKIIKACAELEVVRVRGFENYFDDQRFGGYDPLQGFVAEKALKGQFNGALRAYCTLIRPHDPRQERQRKLFISQHWKQWDACRAQVRTDAEKAIFTYLLTHPTGFLDALRMIPREEFSASIAGYQAFLWNEVLRAIVSSAGQPPLRRHPGVAGEYVFGADPSMFIGLDIPVTGSKMGKVPAQIAILYQDVMEHNGIKPALFNKMKVRQAYFKSFPRPATVRAINVRYEAMADERSPGKKKCVFYFSLPSGCFATMLIKRIFS